MRVQLELDHRLRQIGLAARILPALTARHGQAERARLVAALNRNDMAALRPQFQTERRTVDRTVWRHLEEARTLASHSVAPAAYLARLDELELELTLIEVLGDSKQVKAMALRRYGNGRQQTPRGHSLAKVAAHLLENVPPDTQEQKQLSPTGTHSVESVLRSVAMAAGVPITVKVEKNLVANAAAGEKTVFISERPLGEREVYRLAAHEILAHLVAAANARAQRVGLWQVGSAGSFGDQEGLALHLEERSGLIDARRVRIIAARVWTTDRMHDGASFAEVVRDLVRDFAFDAPDAVALGERAFRGGGLARDAAYLHGWLRVRAAVAAGASVDALRIGRISCDDLALIDSLARDGWMRPATYQPSLARSLSATALGTNCWTSPPSLAASLMIFEET